MTDNSMSSRRALPDEVGRIGDWRWRKFEQVVLIEVALPSGDVITQFYIPEDTTVEDLYLTVKEQSANFVTNDIKLVYEQQYLHEDEKLLYEVFPCQEARVFSLTLVLSSPI